MAELMALVGFFSLAGVLFTLLTGVMRGELAKAIPRAVPLLAMGVLGIGGPGLLQGLINAVLGLMWSVTGGKGKAPAVDLTPTSTKSSSTHASTHHTSAHTSTHPVTAASHPVHVNWSLIGACALGALALSALVVAGVVVGRALARARSERRDRRDARAAAQRVLDERLSAVLARRDALLNEQARHLLDVERVFRLPLLSDVSTRETARSVETTEALTSAPEPTASEASLARYEALVGAAASAWRVALTRAERVGLGAMSRDERKRVERAIKLLAIARDEAASETERQAAYNQALKLVEGLIVVPEKARLALQAQARLAIAA